MHWKVRVSDRFRRAPAWDSRVLRSVSRRALTWLGVVLALGLAPDRAVATTPGPVQLISSASDGTPGNQGSRDIAWSPDGQKIAFFSPATNLAPNPPTAGQSEIYVKNLAND